MTSSIAAALGVPPSNELTPHTLSNAILASFQDLGINPQDFPRLAPRLSQSSLDLLGAYHSQTRSSQDVALGIDRFYASRKKEYVDLLEEIKSSSRLLDVLSEFLAQFQGDLSSVSNSIADLQGRSKTIENRLEGRRVLESKLRPYIFETAVPPDLISTIMETEPNDGWLAAIEQLEVRLVGLRTRSRIERQPVDHHDPSERIADKLRLKASDKIRNLFIDSLAPFRLSISPNLQMVQSTVFLKFQPLFAFLQRHSARIAHEVQKAYVGTSLWYFETSFRRYVRALDKIAARGFPRFGLVAHLPPTADLIDPSAVAHSKSEGSEVILAHTADDSSCCHPPEALFRSLSLVVIDNALSEWSFLSHFFGGQASLAGGGDQSDSKTLSRFATSSSSRLDSPSPSTSSMVRKQSVAHSLADSDSYMAESHSEIVSMSASTEQRSQTVIDLLFKQIMAPVFEYHKTFTGSLLSTNVPPDTHGVFAMIQVNEGLMRSHGGSCGLLETHLMGIKMQLWPQFQRRMDQETEAMRSLPQRGVEETDVERICARYVTFFSTISALEVNQTDIDKVIVHLRNLRQLLLLAIQNLASTNPSRKSLSPNHFFQLVIAALTEFPSHHPRCQAELAFWRELVLRSR